MEDLHGCACGGGGSGTFEFDAQLGQRLLHTLTLSLPHEAVVDVHGDDLLLVQRFVEERRAHRGVHAAAQQHLQVRKRGGSVVVGTAPTNRDQD